MPVAEEIKELDKKGAKKENLAELVSPPDNE